MCLNVNGKQVRKTTGTDKKELAKKVYYKVQTQIAEGKWFEAQKAKSILFSKMVEKYMKRHAKKRDIYAVKRFLPVFGHYAISEITTEMCAEYREERLKTVSPSCVYAELGLMRRMFNVARREWKWTKENPVADLSFAVGNSNARDRWLTHEEEEALMAASGRPKWLRSMLIVALHSGMRRGEILALRWQDIDFNRGILTVHKSKNKEKRGIPLTERLQETLKALKEETKVIDISGRVFPISASSVRQAFVRACEKAGVEDFRFHDLRHTFATRLVQGGIDLYRVQRLLGHKSITMTMRYAHHHPESLRECVAVLDKSITNLSQSRPDGLTTSQKML